MRGSPVLQRGYSLDHSRDAGELLLHHKFSLLQVQWCCLVKAGNQRSTEINLEKENTYSVTLSTPMAVKAAVFTPWIYHTKVKAMKATDAAKWTVPGLWAS